MMSNPWIAMTVLCVGAWAGLPRTTGPYVQSQTAPGLETPGLQIVDAPMTDLSEDPGLVRLQDLSGLLPAGRSMQWSAQAPDEEDMASLHAQSTDSLQGMSWTLPKGIQALHLREGQAQIIEEPDRWRVVAGPGRRLAVHWQQRRS